MQLIECKACGSRELVQEDGVVVCAYCQARYLPEAGSAQAAPPPVLEVPKTQFDVVLHSLAQGGRDKIKAIKAIRKLTGLGLKEAMDLVDSAPTVVLANVDRDVAEKAKAQLEGSGCNVTVG